ncbi:hypothetical protein [Actinoplanes lobatus]|uniref:Uncharacterized protein n=1 Tax=Actinoplanes lobatus TaxID=113568 RepID=A0A7W7MM79_9ACTN|nr:hypothetical protein [Actinoplanes lobatus]MBB4755298.1 hypothetical protein [Actinoplanes lobatus]GIE46206.1 hypothetical protein Alo02nite_91040 [Actinoplanes lobatus]
MSQIEYASADDLLAEIEEESGADVALPSGKTVRVRGLSRYEWFLAGKLSPDGDGNVFETHMVQMGLVAPSMSAAQVEAWRKRPGRAPDLGAVSDKIRELSGHGEAAQKSDPGAAGE